MGSSAFEWTKTPSNSENSISEINSEDIKSQMTSTIHGQDQFFSANEYFSDPPSFSNVSQDIISPNPATQLAFAPTFSSNGNTVAESVSPFLKIPQEMVSGICKHLDNRNIKNLRLVCSRLGSFAECHMDRVFISPDRRVLEVFWAVAKDSRYIGKVKQILWDNSVSNDTKSFDTEEKDVERFLHACWRRQNEWKDIWYFGEEYRKCYEEVMGQEMSPVQFELYNSAHWYVDASNFPMDEEMIIQNEAYSAHRLLVQEQNEIIDGGKHFEALTYGLKVFPCLESLVYTDPWDFGQLSRPLPHLLSPQFLYPGRSHLSYLGGTTQADAAAEDKCEKEKKWCQEVTWGKEEKVEKAKSLYFQDFSDYHVITSLLANIKRQTPLTRLHLDINWRYFVHINESRSPTEFDCVEDSTFQNSFLLFQNLRELYAHIEIPDYDLGYNIVTRNLLQKKIRGASNLFTRANKLEELSIIYGRLNDRWGHGGTFILPRDPSKIWPFLRIIHIQNFGTTCETIQQFLLNLPMSVEKVCLYNLLFISK